MGARALSYERGRRHTTALQHHRGLPARIDEKHPENQALISTHQVKRFTYREFDYALKQSGTETLVLMHSFQSSHYYEMLLELCKEIPESRPALPVRSRRSRAR